MRRLLTVTYTWARRCAIAALGGSVLLIGILMIVFPGPAFVVIPAGLAILGLEFECARRWLHQLRTTGTEMIGKTRLWLRPGSGSSSKQIAIQESQLERDATRVDRLERVRANTKTGYYRVP